MTIVHYQVFNTAGLCLAKFTIRGDAYKYCEKMNKDFFGGYHVQEIEGAI